MDQTASDIASTNNEQQCLYMHSYFLEVNNEDLIDLPVKQVDDND